MPGIINIMGQLTKQIKISGEDDGIGKHGLPPCTTTSKVQLNYRKPFRTFGN